MRAFNRLADVLEAGPPAPAVSPTTTTAPTAPVDAQPTPE
jgi:hypothetical protein